MQPTTITAAVIRYRDGHAEVVTRAGYLEPHTFARQLEAKSGGSVAAVRHERLQPNGGARQTVAIHKVGTDG
jgi:hypothetical protein